MNFLGPSFNTDVVLLPRNEGKIKSYQSCSDLRAWSLDRGARDRHLREWIKHDMPICVLPVCTLAGFLRTITCRSRSRTTPRCHPDCKSKMLLDSICTSCHAVKQCLRNDTKFDKYFAEEEFETSHWPCEGCLDVLKSIKMFWKIILEKIFCVTISKNEEFEIMQDDHNVTVQSVAKLWEKEIVQQAMFVKNVTPLLSRELHRKSSPWRVPCAGKETHTFMSKPSKVDPKDITHSFKITKITKSTTSSISTQRTRHTSPGRLSCTLSKSYDKPSRKVHRCTSVRVKTLDKACDTCSIENDDIRSLKQNVVYLQTRCSEQEDEIKTLQKQNHSLKIEVQNIYKSPTWKPSILSNVPPAAECDKDLCVPKPFEYCIDNNEDENLLGNVDSEMIITMKNCRNEGFKHVSLLQVLHKTNEPAVLTKYARLPSNRKENPVDLLTKVHNTFGEIVKREIMIVTSRPRTNYSEINASFHKLNNSRSAPSSSTTCTGSSGSNFMDAGHKI